MKNLEQAQEALTDMPPRSEAELDPVTLHNMALMHMDTDATGGLRKLNFLLSQVPPPPHAKKNSMARYPALTHTRYSYRARRIPGVPAKKRFC